MVKETNKAKINKAEQKQTGATQTRTPARAPEKAARIVVTDGNVEELFKRFQSMSEDDPEWDALGDALGRYAFE